MLFTRIAILSFFIIFSSFVVADTIYVDVDAGGLNNGSSWADAYTTIQLGIDNSLDGDVVIVAEGVYSEHIDLDGMNIELRSTDPNDPAVVAATIIDGGNTATVVKCNSGERADTIINGFQIQNGKGNNSNNAGGIYCFSTCPTIMNCILINNTAINYGGGIFCYYDTSIGGPTISNCKFIGNVAGSYGSGVSCFSSDATISNCVFSGNINSDNGGGIYSYNCDPLIINCSFSQNSSDAGGAIYCRNGSPVIVNSIMWGNSASSENEIFVNNSSVSVDYSVVAGGWSGTGSDNYSFAPAFNDPNGADDTPGTADDDLSLHPYSLCINSGDPFGDYEDLVDMDGQARLAYGQVDIGADEVFPIGADLDGNGQVDTDDLSDFVEGWLIDVDLIDFTFFAEQWLYGVESGIVE